MKFICYGLFTMVFSLNVAFAQINHSESVTDKTKTQYDSDFEAGYSIGYAQESGVNKSEIMKMLASTYHVDVSKLAFIASTEESSVANVCEKFKEFNMLKNIEGFDLSSYKPKGIFGKKKKIKKAEYLKAGLIIRSVLILDTCDNHNKDENVKGRINQLLQDLKVSSELFLELVYKSK